MPRLRNPLTLKNICINVITCNFDRLWGEDFDSQFGNISSQLMHVIGPFNDLPGHICEEIFHSLVKRRVVRSTHLHLLLGPQTTCVHFSPTSAGSLISHALTLLSYRCRKLKSLDLTDCRYVSPQSISKCLPSLSSLRKLILRQTKTNPAILKIIASYLPHLVHLDLHGCPVTNSGAFLLCGDGGDFEPVCQNLSVLDISGTRIELSGCVAIVGCFRNLRLLSFPDSLEAVAQLHADRAGVVNGVNGVAEGASNCEPGTSCGGTEKTRSALHHKLEVLYASAIRCRKIDPESVQLACSYCPYIREVYWYHDASDESLKHLLCLQHLCVLEVSSDNHDTVSFHGGIKPLLVSRGKEMMAVGLYDVQGVDMGMLGCLCPQLKRLKVVSLSAEADFAQSYLTASQEAGSFRELRQLMLVLDAHSNQFDPSDLLVRCQTLQEVHLIGVSCLTDQSLEAALTSHGFSCMKELQLESCDLITLSSVTRFVRACDQLASVSLCGCHLITHQDAEELKSLISKEGLDISVKWN